MNKDQVEGESTQFFARLKETWAKLTDDDHALYEAQRDQFLGRVQEEYGLSVEHADQRLKKLEEEHAQNN